MPEPNKGTYNKKLYKYVIDAYERSLKYLKNLNYYEDLKKNSELYNTGNIWKAKKEVPSQDHLSAVSLGSLAFDITEVGVAIAASRLPAPEIDAMIGIENQEYMQINEMFQVAEKEENEEIAEQAQVALDIFRDRLNEYGDSVQREIISILKENKMLYKAQELYREKSKHGDGCLRSELNSETQKWTTEICDATTIFPAPSINTIEDHPKHKEPFIYATVMTVAKAMQEFNLDAIDKAAIGEHTNDNLFKVKTTYTEKVKAAIRSAVDSKSQLKEYVYVIRCYMPDFEEEEIEVDMPVYDEDGKSKLDDNGEQITEKVNRRKYSTGFKVVTVIKDHQDYVVAEKENLYKDGIPPFRKIKNYAQANSFFGVSEFKHIEDFIIHASALLSAAQDNQKYFGNPMLLKHPNCKRDDDEPLTNEAGQILESEMGSAGAGFLTPPTLGNDYKYLIEFYMSIIDRITRLAEAIRGGNEFANDSGKKIRELRAAATGLFQPKVDEMIRFYIELFEHWTYAIQNLYQKPVLQKVSDVDGKDQYEEFVPSAGREIDLVVNVANGSILPKDLVGSYEELKELFGMQDEFGLPLVSGEEVIKSAPSLENKIQLIDSYNDRREQMQIEAQRQQALEAFTQLAEQVIEMSEAAAQNLQVLDGTQEEDAAFEDLFEILEEHPEFLKEQAFQMLPERLKEALLKALVVNVSPEPMQEQAA